MLSNYKTKYYHVNHLYYIKLEEIAEVDPKNTKINIYLIANLQHAPMHMYRLLNGNQKDC